MKIDPYGDRPNTKFLDCGLMLKDEYEEYKGHMPNIDKAYWLYDTEADENSPEDDSEPNVFGYTVDNDGTVTRLMVTDVNDDTYNPTCGVSPVLKCDKSKEDVIIPGARYIIKSKDFEGQFIRLLNGDYKYEGILAETTIYEVDKYLCNWFEKYFSEDGYTVTIADDSVQIHPIKMLLELERERRAMWKKYLPIMWAIAMLLLIVYILHITGIF